MPALKVEALSGKKMDVGGAYKGTRPPAGCLGLVVRPLQAGAAHARRDGPAPEGQGIDILAVSVDQERANVDKFLRGHGAWSLTIAHDPNGSIADRLQPEKMPTSYVIDRAGIVRYVNAGFVPEDAQTIERRLLEVAGR